MVVPWPGALSAVIVPPWASTSWREIASLVGEETQPCNGSQQDQSCQNTKNDVSGHC